MCIRFCLFLTTCIIFSASSAMTETWTIDRTVTTAVEVSNTVALERLDIDLSYLDAVSARMEWFPKLSFNAGVKYISEVMEIKMPFQTIRFGDNDTYDFNIQFNQLLYDGGRLKAIRDASEKRSLMSANRAKAVALAVEFRAKAAFFGVAITEQTLKSSEQSLLEAKNHLYDVKARFKQGMTLENDVVSAELRVSQAEMDIISHQASRERAKAVFRKITGLGHDEPVTIEWKDKSALFSEIPRIETALEKRPEYKAFNAAIDASKWTARGSRADRRPQISMFGAFNYGKPGLDLPANEWMHYLSGGVFLKWNILDWGASTRNTEKSFIAMKKTEKQRDDFTRNLAEQFSEALSEYAEAEKRQKLSEQAAAFAHRQMELINAAYRAGTATETDYANAHASFTRATLDKTISTVALRFAEAKIDYVLGIRYNGGKND